MNIQPPKWADRFLAWYCNPDLLEEIQGDTHELYFSRVSREGKWRADLKYVWDVIRFFRWSNIRRQSLREDPAGKPWRVNFRIASRTASRRKFIFAIKTAGLSICLAFALLILAYVLNEYTYDEFHEDHDRIYRITSKVNFGDHVTHYAVTPLPIGKELADNIPEIERYFRFMYEDHPVYTIGDQVFTTETTFAADSNFLSVLRFDFLSGGKEALHEPNSIVLTESLARKFFGAEPAQGQMVRLGRETLLNVTAVIRDVPVNSHLHFDALVSWDTYDRYDDWGNLNAYSYILLKPGATIDAVKQKMHGQLTNFRELVEREYNATFEPQLEKIADIHFSGPLDEDIADKKSKTNLVILLSVMVLFLITGIINYLNLSLAELTASMKRLSVLRIFGGVTDGHRKMLQAETLFALIVVIPLSGILVYWGWLSAGKYLALRMEDSIFLHPYFAGTCCCVGMLILLSSRLNATVLSKVNFRIDGPRMSAGLKGAGTSLRRILVGVQLSFSIVMIALIFVIVDQFTFIQNSDKGFDDKNTLVVKLRPVDPSLVSLFVDQIRSINGIRKADVSSYFPGIIETKYVFRMETESGMKELLVPMIHCGYDYLDVLNVRLAAGRGFEQKYSEDKTGSFIINETAAREFGWNDAIGRSIQGPVGGQGETEREGKVIGVVRDFNFASLHSRIEPLIIFLTDENWGSPFVYIKIDPLHRADLIASIHEVYKNQWPELPFEWEYLDSKYFSLYKKDYEIKSIFESGLLISILISCLSIFSIAALFSSLRSKEMGIRKIAGASSYQLVVLQARTFLYFLIFSLLAACPVIWYLSEQWLLNFSYHISFTVWYFVFPGMVTFFIIMLTAGYHGLRSARVNPVDVLKHD